MDRRTAQEKLLRAEAFVATGEQRIANQRLAIADRAARGLNNVLASELLVEMMDAQKILVAYRDRLRALTEGRLAGS